MSESLPSGDHFHATSHAEISQIPVEDWNACVGVDDAPLCHANLSALESAGIATPQTGFSPCHIVLRGSDGRVAAVAPAYLKTHSRGELAVDLGLSLAHDRSVGPYYPKLQVEVPMAPFAGQRMLIRAEVNRGAAIHALAAALKDLAVARGASSVQITHMTADPEDLKMLRTAGFATAQSNTYTWRPGPDRSFDDYLGRMLSHDRSEIRRQRRRLQPLGLTFRHFRGDSISPDMAEPFFELYRANFARHKTEAWHNIAYFRQVLTTMPDSIDLSVCLQDGKWIGAVFNVGGPPQGYSLYWGQAGDIRYLHFEQVFYRGIERALICGFDRLDFGPTGAHKAERGIGIEPVHHALWFRDPAFKDIADSACARKTNVAEAERATETARLPFVAGR
jgi:predicted N-acyltransferase